MAASTAVGTEKGYLHKLLSMIRSIRIMMNYRQLQYEIFGSMESEIRKSLETGQEYEEQNWWEIDRVHQEIINHGFSGDGNQGSEKMDGISLEIMELFGNGQDLGGAVLERQELDFQKYES